MRSEDAVRVAGAVSLLAFTSCTPRADHPAPTTSPRLEAPAAPAATTPAAAPTCESDPTPEFLATTARAPFDSILLQLDRTGTFILVPPFVRAPPLTLFTSGRMVYTPPSRETEEVLTLQLDPNEASAIASHVWNLGFERLVSHVSDCSCDIATKGASPDAGPRAFSKICVSDAGYTILRLRTPAGKLQHLVVYSDYVNEPAIMEAIGEYVDELRSRPGQPFVPQKATALVLRSGNAPEPCPDIDVAWIGRPGDGGFAWATDVEGPRLDELVARWGAGLPSVRFCSKKRNEGFLLQILPWLPGAQRAATEFDASRVK
jgi:hypothetical protein